MTEREALKLALEALEQTTYAFLDTEGNHGQIETDAIDASYKAITAIKEALAKPEQEPVACVQDLDEVKRKHLVYEKGMDWKDPLYTTPPQRTWVGLTEEDKQKAFDDTQEGGGFWEFADAIEAKLKEKNT